MLRKPNNRRSSVNALSGCPCGPGPEPASERFLEPGQGHDGDVGPAGEQVMDRGPVDPRFCGQCAQWKTQLLQRFAHVTGESLGFGYPHGGPGPDASVQELALDVVERWTRMAKLTRHSPTAYHGPDLPTGTTPGDGVDERMFGPYCGEKPTLLARAQGGPDHG